MNLIFHPHPFLRYKAIQNPVGHPKDILKVVREMLSLLEYTKGEGLAATQVGLDWRLFVSTFGVFLNPQIFYDPTGMTPLVTSEEGCLSVPGRFEQIRRHESITLSAYHIDGHPYSRRFSGFKARVVQHEVDHLDGILFTDHVGGGI